MENDWFFIYIYHMMAVGTYSLYPFINKIEGIDDNDILNFYKWKAGVYPYGN